jgi:hypothetical protein
VVTQQTTGNRVHVFRHRIDAEKHAALFGGILLPESERPFRAGLAQHASRASELSP